jgi:hypothetical protein
MTLRADTLLVETKADIDRRHEQFIKQMAKTHAAWAMAFTATLVAFAVLIGALLHAESVYERQDKIDREMTYHG